MDDLLKEIGQRLRQCRKKCNLSQEKLAELIGVTAQTISTAETGKKALRPENIIKICEVLNTSPNYLLLGEVLPKERVILSEKALPLSPNQYRHLESIIDSFVAALAEED